MSIRVICPNGHKLKIKDRFAGQVGLCPICKSRIQVPDPKEDVLEEGSIMDILQPQESGLSGIALETPDFDNEPADRWSGEGAQTATKMCSKCLKEIPSEAHVCPHCKTYVATLSDM